MAPSLVDIYLVMNAITLAQTTVYNQSIQTAPSPLQINCLNYFCGLRWGEAGVEKVLQFSNNEF